MRIETITPEYVEFIPKELQGGKLYISEKYSIAAHLCVCGCGNKVVTPLSPASWSLREKDGLVTLYPSIGNWNFPCNSHYWITSNAIRWSRKFTEEEIRGVRRRDAADKKIEIDRINRDRLNPSSKTQPSAEASSSSSFYDSFKKWLKDFLS